MKFIAFLSVLFISLTTMAAGVDGALFYNLPSGELAVRDVTLTVPTRGQGDVILSGSKFEWVTDNFWSETIDGTTYFTAVFKSEFQGLKSMIALQGIYEKSDTLIKYIGEMYKKKGHHEVEDDISDFSQVGGFGFTYIR